MMKRTYDLYTEWLDGAEDDIYVKGDAGFATINNVSVKK